MKNLIYILVPFFLLSCADVAQQKEESTLTKNSDSDDITFIIDLKVNPDSNEELNLFVEEITQNVIDNEDFCLEYAYYVTEDKSSVTLYEKYIDSESAVKHGQNFMGSPFFERFFLVRFHKTQRFRLVLHGLTRIKYILCLQPLTDIV